MANAIQVLSVLETMGLQDGKPVQVVRVEWKLSDTAGPFTDEFPKGTTSVDINQRLEARATEIRQIVGLP